MPTRYVTFLWQFARRPVSTGAIAPSSHGLAHRMVDESGVEEAKLVFELGAGTGAFTEEILERMNPEGTFVAVEVNPQMVKHLRKRFPGLSVMEESAENLGDFRARHGLARADSVLCGLPWALFKPDTQVRLLDAVVENLRPGGTFATFAYWHASWFPTARRLESMLRERFGVVARSKVVWWNLPPAFVYRCRKDANNQARKTEGGGAA